MTGDSHLRDLNEVLRDELYVRQKIMSVLASGPKTVPEIAKELGAVNQDVMKWVMAMRRYGRIEEVPKDRMDDYYRYKLVEEKK